MFEPDLNAESEINSIDDIEKLSNGSVSLPDSNVDATAVLDNTVDAPVYEPNFKYNVKDNEFEFDDRVKTIIKSKDDEDYFRDIYTKANGLDNYKQKVSDYEARNSNLENGIEELSLGFKKIKDLRDSGNIKDLTHVLGIKEDDLVDYALSLARRNQLPQEERDRLIKLEQHERENAELKTKVEKLEQTFSKTTHESEVQKDFRELQGLVSNSESLRDAMKSNGLDLQSEAINEGIAAFGRTGKEISIQEAFNAVVKKYNFLTNINKPIEPVITRKDTLPIIRGGSSAPISEEITSIDQLRLMADKF